MFHDSFAKDSSQGKKRPVSSLNSADLSGAPRLWGVITEVTQNDLCFVSSEWKDGVSWKKIKSQCNGIVEFNGLVLQNKASQLFLEPCQTVES